MHLIVNGVVAVNQNGVMARFYHLGLNIYAEIAILSHKLWSQPVFMPSHSFRRRVWQEHLWFHQRTFHFDHTRDADIA